MTQVQVSAADNNNKNKTDKEIQAIIEKMLSVGTIINDMIWDLIALSRKIEKDEM